MPRVLQGRNQRVFDLVRSVSSRRKSDISDTKNLVTNQGCISTENTLEKGRLIVDSAI